MTALVLQVAVPQPVLAQSPVNAEEENDHLRVRGLIVAKHRIEYRSKLSAPVASTPFLEGQSFLEGDLIASLDCTDLRAQVRAAEAAAKGAAIERDTKRRLVNLGAAGRDEYALAAALAEKSQAELDYQAGQLRWCGFKAPFSGTVVQLSARALEFPPTDQPLVTIVSDNLHELEMVVPSAWLVWMKSKTSFTFKIDETGRRTEGAVSRIGAEVDPVSQTIRVYGVLRAVPKNTKAGMSGTARFKVPSG